MARQIFWLGVAVVSFAAAPLQIRAQSSPADLLVNKARSLETRGRADLAAQTWQQILMMTPDHQEALAGLARAAKQAGKEGEAKTYLERLRKINPQHAALAPPPAPGKVERSKPELEEAARFAQQGQFDKAVAGYRQAFGGNVPPGKMSVAYYETLASTAGGWEKAATGLETLLKKQPDSAEYKLALGRLYSYRPAVRLKGLGLLQSVSGEPATASQAQQAWRQALVWENGNPRSQASLRSYLGKYPDADLEKLAKTPAASPAQDLTAGVDVQRAYQAMKRNELDEAETRFTEALKKNSKNAGALTGLGFVRMKQQDFAGALKHFESAAAITPENRILRDAVKEARFWLTMQDGAKALRESRGPDAEASYRKALEQRPASTQALGGLAGALMQRDDAEAAAPILERLLKAEPNNVEAWQSFVRAKHRRWGARAALELVRTIPQPVAVSLSNNVEYMTALAGIYRDAGRPTEAAKAFSTVITLLKSNRTELPLYVEVQLAGLYLEYGDVLEAANHYRAAMAAQPENLDAWEGFLVAMHRAKNPGAALKTLERLPETVHTAAQARPAFLRAVAALQTQAGDLASAETLLNRVEKIETADGKQSSFYTQLQLAQLWLEQGKGTKAAQSFASLAKAYPDNLDAWKGWIFALNREHRYDEAASAARSTTEEMAVRLQNDADYIAVMASVYRETGAHEEAIQVLRLAVARYTNEKRPVPPAVVTQLGWLLLGNPGNERELFALLRDARVRTDFPPKERKAVTDIWTAWVSQSADAAVAGGDAPRAVAILEAGIRMLPGETRLHRVLAATLLNAGDSKRALAIYKSSGLQNATTTDYVAAVGTAATERDKIAALWLADGLKKFPNDSELLNLAGKQAALRGDFKKAEGYWRLALQAMEMQARAGAAQTLQASGVASNLKPGDPADDFGILMLSRAPAESPTAPPPQRSGNAPGYRLPWDTAAIPSPTAVSVAPPAVGSVDRTSGERPADALLKELLAAPVPKDMPAVSASMNTAAAPRNAPFLVASIKPVVPSTSKQAVDQMLEALQVPDGRAALQQQLKEEMKAAPAAGSVNIAHRGGNLGDLLLGKTQAFETSPIVGEAGGGRGKIEDQIRAMDSRNTPYVGLGGVFQTRAGNAGFDRMLLQESDLESSGMLTNKLRVSLIAKSIFADTGASDGNSELRYGMLPLGDSFQAQTVNGLGAEAQLSGENFGLRFGSTPRGFLVRNFVGGLRFRPGGGPITLTLDRDSVKDTLLSYAGSRDPISNRVWGGVMADTASAAGNWGDEKSGAYFNVGYQRLTGKSVQTNRRLDATIGGYWRLLNTAAGSLNAGVNLFTMHYEKNLRFFTLGHGGYFSPQRFMLFNVPVGWNGKWKQLQYSVSTSIGSQSFTEDSSPYFPLDPSVQGKSGSYYPKFASSGVNYNVDFRAAYQLSENWFLGGYMNVNNARFYSLQSSGLFVKYAFRPRPLMSDFSVPSVPDWRGRQPFGLP